MEAKVKKEIESGGQPPVQGTTIGFGERLGYGMGDFASNIVFAAIATFLTYYYTDVVGVSAAIVGTILLFSRVFDGVTDIGMGFVVDKTKSKHGKARPWLLWLALPFALLTVLLFSVPEMGTAATIIYIVVTYNLLNLVYTGINIPYGVLNSLLSQDQYQRSVLNIFRMFMAIAATLLISVMVLPMVDFFGGGSIGWQITFALFALLAFGFFLTTFFTTKERVQAADPSKESQNIPLKKGLKALFKNKYWCLMVFFMIATYSLQGLNTGVNVYYAEYILNDPGLVGLLTAVSLVPMLATMLVMAPFIKRVGKRNAIISGCIGIGIGTAVIAVNPESLTFVIIGTIIRGIAMAPVTGSMFAMLADTIEYGEWKTGVRTEGLVYSAGSFGTKVGNGLGAAMIGWILAFGGYLSGTAGGQQPESALIAIEFMFIYMPLIFALIQLVLMLFYKLDKLYPQIVSDLKDRSETIRE
ncbi:MFS transporter [Salsuginibacillus kocurii]|uniref:MFS transporter n=1 Tax=Salsuginibacillus kocurii TaxID=427078 RepID=UPI00037A54CF|nr:MFS transporter [Salsuginibacillus kocurii]